MSERVPVLAVRAILSGCKNLGLDMSRIFRAGTITPSAIEDPYASLPGDVLTTLWALAFDQRPDVTLPTQVGFGLQDYELDLLDHIAGTADTVGQALQIVDRYRGIVSHDVSLYIERGAHDWIWLHDRGPEPYRAVMEQWALAVLYGRQRLTPGFAIDEVHLTHADHGSTRCFERLWSVPVTLESRRTGMRLSKGVWDVPNPYADPDLRKTLTRVADELGASILDRLSIRERMFESFCGGRFLARDVAAHMQMSTRSLQRRLADERISFTETLDTYRRERTFARLREGERDIGAIAYAIGYKDQSSFNRSFRRWTGITPTEWIRLRLDTT